MRYYADFSPSARLCGAMRIFGPVLYYADFRQGLCYVDFMLVGSMLYYADFRGKYDVLHIPKIR